MRHPGFTRLEMAAILGVLTLLVAILYPVYAALRNKYRGLVCMKSQIQVQVAWHFYRSDYDDHLVPVAMDRPAPRSAIVPGAQTWWPDLLLPYIKNQEVLQCPDRAPWGIGLSRPEIGVWLEGSPSYAEIAAPDKTVVMADAGFVTNPEETDPDQWREDPGRVHVFFVTPADPKLFAQEPHRIVNRHNGDAVVVFADGRVLWRKASEVGLQHPKGHPEAMWDLE